MKKSRNTVKKISLARRGSKQKLRHKSGKKLHVLWYLSVAILLIAYSWAFYHFFVVPYSYRWKAVYGDPIYPQGYDIHGIDISHYQGNIDWHILRSNAMVDKCPLRFVMIKATEGSTEVDKCFESNFYNAKKQGFIRGAYHFWSTYSSAKKQAQHFIRTVNLDVGDLPPVLDIENKAHGQTPEEFKRDVLQWLNIVEEHYGVKPIIYTYYKFKTTYLSDSIFDAYPYWIAHYYVSKVKYGGKWKFWQHTDCGKLPGIEGNVDLDIYNGSYYDLMHLTIGREYERD